jgi:hypothetical protein
MMSSLYRSPGLDGRLFETPNGLTYPFSLTHYLSSVEHIIFLQSNTLSLSQANQSLLLFLNIGWRSSKYKRLAIGLTLDPEQARTHYTSSDITFFKCFNFCFRVQPVSKDLVENCRDFMPADLIKTHIKTSC